MASRLEIVVGTYEYFLLGYKLAIKNDKSVLTQSFADKSHSGAIKCLAVQKNYVATGSTDDRIFIYDMALRKQVQILLPHDGTINALGFTPDNTHLLSGGEDGKMIATRINTWIAEGVWAKAHNGKAVTHISCHPSGKLALSLGGDFILRTWNLVKGRVAYKKNLKSHGFFGTLPDNLLWSPSGEYFSLTGQRSVDFWYIKTADLVRSHKTSCKPTSLCWLTDNTCVVGLENGQIIFKQIDKEDEQIFDAHSARVKCLAYIKEYLVSACSNGVIILWKVNATPPELEKIASANIDCRPTCIGLLDLEGVETKPTDKIEYKELPVKFENVKSQERGRVTIEYENDDQEDKPKKVVKKKSKAKKVAVQTQEESDDVNSVDEDDDNDDDDQESKDNSDSEKSVSEETAESEEEVALPKPGSRKRKIRKR